jgi:hypothetical protein
VIVTDVVLTPITFAIEATMAARPEALRNELNGPFEKLKTN